MYFNILDYEASKLPPEERLPNYLATFSPGNGGGMAETKERFCCCIFCQRTGYHKIITMAANNELLECPRCKLQFIKAKES